ncbi:MAG: OmpA family protein [Flavobacteriales bacterium]|nr:OmpA family protein [Flavobacteriales bacterium]
MRKALFIFCFSVCISVLQAQPIRVYFALNAHELSIENQTFIKSKLPENFRTCTFDLEGRAGRKGSADYTLKLSEKRALSVKQLLLESGVPEPQISLRFTGNTLADKHEEQETDRVVLISITLPEIKKEPEIVPPTPERLVFVELKDLITRSPITGLAGSYVISPAGAEIQLSPSATSITFSSNGYKDTTLTIKPGAQKITAFLLPEHVQEIIISENIYFYGGSPEILPESFRAIDYLYMRLQDRKDIKIEIHGHVNWPLHQPRSAEKEIENQILSERRAEAVKQQLIKRGIPKESISAAGFGSSRMVNPYAMTEGEQAQNRRVEVIILAK